MLSLSGMIFIIIFNYCEIRFIQTIIDVIYYVTIENDTSPKIKTGQSLLGNRSC